jgi:hypothetical protein
MSEQGKYYILIAATAIQTKNSKVVVANNLSFINFQLAIFLKYTALTSKYLLTKLKNFYYQRIIMRTAYMR